MKCDEQQREFWGDGKLHGTLHLTTLFSAGFSCTVVQQRWTPFNSVNLTLKLVLSIKFYWRLEPVMRRWEDRLINSLKNKPDIVV